MKTVWYCQTTDVGQWNIKVEVVSSYNDIVLIRGQMLGGTAISLIDYNEYLAVRSSELREIPE